MSKVHKISKTNMFTATSPNTPANCNKNMSDGAAKDINFIIGDSASNIYSIHLLLSLLDMIVII